MGNIKDGKHEATVAEVKQSIFYSPIQQGPGLPLNAWCAYQTLLAAIGQDLPLGQVIDWFAGDDVMEPGFLSADLPPEVPAPTMTVLTPKTGEMILGPFESSEQLAVFSGPLPATGKYFVSMAPDFALIGTDLCAMTMTIVSPAFTEGKPFILRSDGQMLTNDPSELPVVVDADAIGQPVVLLIDMDAGGSVSIITKNGTFNDVTTVAAGYIAFCSLLRIGATEDSVTVRGMWSPDELDAAPHVIPEGYTPLGYVTPSETVIPAEANNGDTLWAKENLTYNGVDYVAANNEGAIVLDKLTGAVMPVKLGASGGVPEAADDDQIHGRQNNEWVSVYAAYPLNASEAEMLALGATGKLPLDATQQAGTYVCQGSLPAISNLAAVPTGYPTPARTFDLTVGKKIVQVEMSVPRLDAGGGGGMVVQVVAQVQSPGATIFGAELLALDNNTVSLVFNGDTVVYDAFINKDKVLVTFEFDATAAKVAARVDGELVVLSDDSYLPAANATITMSINEMEAAPALLAGKLATVAVKTDAAQIQAPVSLGYTDMLGRAVSALSLAPPGMLTAAPGVITSVTIGAGGDYPDWDAAIVELNKTTGLILLVNVVSTAALALPAILFPSFGYVEINWNGHGVAAASVTIGAVGIGWGSRGTLVSPATNELEFLGPMVDPQIVPGTLDIQMDPFGSLTIRGARTDSLISCNASVTCEDSRMGALHTDGILDLVGNNEFFGGTISAKQVYVGQTTTYATSMEMAHPSAESFIICLGGELSVTNSLVGNGNADYAVQLSAGKVRLPTSVTGFNLGPFSPSGSGQQIGTSPWYVA